MGNPAVNSCRIISGLIAKQVAGTSIDSWRDIKNVRILFADSKYFLSPQAKRKLQAVSWILKRNPDMTIAAVGHTSNVGMGNKHLSIRRANAVFNYLRKQGVSRNQLSTKGYGAKYVTGNGNAADRRVQFEILNYPNSSYSSGRSYSYVQQPRPRPVQRRRKLVGVCKNGWKPVKIHSTDSNNSDSLEFKVVPCGNNPILTRKKSEAARKKAEAAREKKREEFLKNLWWTLTPDLRASLYTRHRLLREAVDTGVQASAAFWGIQPSIGMLLGGWQFGVAYSGGADRCCFFVEAVIPVRSIASRTQLSSIVGQSNIACRACLTTAL